jgi:hypothetical protein
MSGMRATTGVRHMAALNKRVLVQATKNGRVAATARETDHARGDMELVCQKDGDEDVIHTPDHSYTKETKNRKEDFAIIEFHFSTLMRNRRSVIVRGQLMNQ